MNQFAKKVRAILEKANKVDSARGESLLAKAQQDRRPLTEVVVKEGVISEKELLCLIGKAANIAPIDLGKLKVEKEVLEAVPVDLARDYHIFPVDRIGSILTIAVANPFDVLKLDDIKGPWVPAATWQNKIYGLPFHNLDMQLFYRKDLIPKAPRTYQEILDVTDMWETFVVER